MALNVVPSFNTVIDRCESTNDLARKLGEQGAPHGTWISARIQEKGRGRLGRKWETLEGNLFLSMIARVESKGLWPWVPLTSAVAVAQVLRKRLPGLEVMIKWPNDLWVRGAKLGGILCEGVGNKDGSFIVIGLGLNCARAPEGLDQATTSLISEVSGSIAKAAEVDGVREAIVEAIPMVLDELYLSGPGLIVERFNRWSALPPGTEIEWSSGNEGDEKHFGTVSGLGPIGELEVRTPEGETHKLYAEDVKVRKA